MKKKNINKRKRNLVVFIVIVFAFAQLGLLYNEITATKLVEAEPPSEDYISVDNIKEQSEKKLIRNKNNSTINNSSNSNKANEEGKVAYLTFDDGPSVETTPEILDILEEYDIKASFFVLGKQSEENPEVLKRIHKEGHAIGNHSYSHIYSHIYKKTSNLISELEITDKILKDILGEDFQTDIMRFPGGSFGKKRASFRKAVKKEGYKYIDWNSLNGDAEGHNISKKRLIKNFKDTYSNQEELIILMHDTDEKRTTAQALPNIIDFLIKEGYKFARFQMEGL